MHLLMLLLPIVLLFNFFWSLYFLFLDLWRRIIPLGPSHLLLLINVKHDTNLKLENCIKIYFVSQHKLKLYYNTIYDAMLII